MPRAKDPTPRKKINLYAPNALLDELQPFRRIGENDTDFYTRILTEGRNHLKGILTGETPVDPVREAEVLAVLKKYGIPVPNLTPPDLETDPGKK